MLHHLMQFLLASEASSDILATFNIPTLITGSMNTTTGWPWFIRNASSTVFLSGINRAFEINKFQKILWNTFELKYHLE